MNILLTKISNSLVKTIKYLTRDFYELEHMQNSEQGRVNFVARAYSKSKERLMEEFSEYDFASIQFSDFKKEILTDGLHLLINPIDSTHNLARSLPFFGIIISIIEFKNQEITPKYSIIHLPVFNEYIYCEKNAGIWIEKTNVESGNKSRRLRTNQIKDWSKAFLAYEASEFDKNIINISGCKSFRNFGSSAYSLSLLLSGKIEAVAIDKKDLATIHAFDLMIVEAGGKYYDLNNYENIRIYSNIHLPNLLQ